MGTLMSTSLSSITEELMEDYLALTYLSRNDILIIYKRLATISPDIHKNIYYRFPWDEIVTVFPELKVNPFADRLCSVFSSQQDSRMSFEDVLDLCSMLSPDCPADCKAKWALRLFDFNDSNSLEVGDIIDIIDRLTLCGEEDPNKNLPYEYKHKIAKLILDEFDLDHTGSIVTMEFVHAVSKIPDFHSSFTLKL